MSRRIYLLCAILVGLGCFAIAQADQKSQPKPIRSWSGKYLHSSGTFELYLEQSKRDKSLLGVEIMQVPASNSRLVLSCFARIEGQSAVFQGPHDPGCKIEFRHGKDGILVTDNCNGHGEESGLYTMVR